MLAGLHHVTFSRDGRPVLRQASLCLERGERLAVLGHNGAGKTTLLRLLAGLDQPEAGTVHRASGGIGYVPQAVGEHLFGWFSVLRNVAMPRQVAGLRDAEDVASALCARLLPGVALSRRAGALSGGEKQAVCLARALATPGELVLADEPFSALAEAARERVRLVFAEELRGRALVLVTHDASDAERLCTRTARLELGELTEAPRLVARAHG